MKKHTNFILSPITNILKDAVTASAGIGNGIETYPLCNYIMQSVFLKMTGFQEQKMKCICWELATNDYDYRYKRFSQKTLGECSCYDEKKIIYQDLIHQIKKYIPDFNIATTINKQDLLTLTISEVKDIFSGTNLLIWNQSNFNEYEKIIKMNIHCFSNIENDTNINCLFVNCSNCPKYVKKRKKCLFTVNSKNLQEIYDTLYAHRNRCAHNSLSYQQNLPTLNTLGKEDYKYENYFIWITVLILIDKIFIELYKKYLEILE